MFNLSEITTTAIAIVNADSLPKNVHVFILFKL